MDWTRWLGDQLLTPEEHAHLQRLALRDEGHGFDRFGFNRQGLEQLVGLLQPLYRHWFRVISHGSEHLPAHGGGLVACNHSGTLPLDAMMLALDVLWHTDPPRALRVVLDDFVGLLPFVNVLFARGGAVGGSRANVHDLLSTGELVGVFPEGVPGMGKRFADRYRLQTWRPGHAELAIRHQVPIVPAAVIGAEEQWPQIGRIDRFHLFGVPYLPIVATPLPLPVRYHIHYGPPIPIPDLYDAEDALRSDAVQEAAGRVRGAVEDLIAKGLSIREGVFA